MTLQFPTHGEDCRQIEALLPPFVDGLAVPATRRQVSAHLERCPTCRRAADAQRAVRGLIVSRRASLGAVAPAALVAGVREVVVAEAVSTPRRAWRPVPALAAAAALVLAVSGGVVWLTGHSSVLLAAQLTLDHLKCFVIDGDAHDTPVSPAEAAGQFKRDYGMTVELPVHGPDPTRARIVGVRQCLYGEGWVAHTLYRVDDQAVSLFVLPGDAEPAQVQAFGRQAEVRRQGGATYVVVAPAGLSQVAAALGFEAE